MSHYIFRGIPKCKTCGRKMDIWNPWADEHEHQKCSLKRLSDDVAISVRNILNGKHIRPNENR